MDGADLNHIKLEASWKSQLVGEFAKPYMSQLRGFLAEQITKRKQVFPKGSEYFAALDRTPYDRVKVVVLGQDPYHGDGQAHGLCFSVKPGVPPPPSLINIYQELTKDVGFRAPAHGYLTHWADQGVLLLNSVLTVERGKAASHRNRGWEQFTDRVVSLINDGPHPVAFMLWGSYAQKKGEVIDRRRHLVLKAPHPSPLSAHRGFFGCRHFSKVNAFLEQQGRGAIDWQLPHQLS